MEGCFEGYNATVLAYGQVSYTSSHLQPLQPRAPCLTGERAALGAAETRLQFCLWSEGAAALLAVALGPGRAGTQAGR